MSLNTSKMNRMFIKCAGCVNSKIYACFFYTVNKFAQILLEKNTVLISIYIGYTNMVGFNTLLLTISLTPEMQNAFIICNNMYCNQVIKKSPTTFCTNAIFRNTHHKWLIGSHSEELATTWHFLFSFINSSVEYFKI